MLFAVYLRPLRNLRENIHISVLNQSAQKNPQCLPQITLIYADTPETTPTVFVCEIMQPATFSTFSLRNLRSLLETALYTKKFF